MYCALINVSIVKWGLRTSIRSTDAKRLCNGGCYLVDRDGNTYLFGHDASTKEE